MCYTKRKCTSISASEKKRIMIIGLRPCKINNSLVGSNVKTNLTFSSNSSFLILSDNISVHHSMLKFDYLEFDK